MFLRQDKQILGIALVSDFCIVPFARWLRLRSFRLGVHALMYSQNQSYMMLIYNIACYDCAQHGVDGQAIYLGLKNNKKNV